MAVQEKIKQLIPEIRLTDNDKLHLTIAFVGEHPEEVKDQLVSLLQQASQGISKFEITPAYIDGFPKLHHAHTLWVGVKGDIDKLMIITERIKDGLIGLHLGVDERRYLPHIAIAKVDDIELTPDLEDRLQRIMMEHFDPIQISSVKLFESIPENGFHSHNTLAEIELY